MKRRNLYIAAAIVCAGLAFAYSQRGQPLPPVLYSSEAIVPGHRIIALSTDSSETYRGWHLNPMAAPNPTANIAGKSIVIAQAQVSVDGKAVASMSDSVEKIRIVERARKIEITADGKSLYQFTR
jgi:hypothetical protein